jgi:tetratricopeptide (TPR) repeat protein
MRPHPLRPGRILAAILFVTTAPLAAQHAHRQASADVPLFDDLGDHHYAVTTSVPGAQAYFDQGMRLYYAFNHQEAVRSFRAAQALDPRCAMCWWGEALAWGPNINLPMDSASAVAAWDAVQGALDRIEHADPKERDLIHALSRRYASPPPADRAALDRAWADALEPLIVAYPDDLEIRVLHAEAVMDLGPWDYWTEDGEPRPGMEQALNDLLYVQEQDREHPGACHFYIHAVEKLYPERAVDCAERLVGLMPGAGHIVHMPGHIYIRVGRYLDAVELNRHAIHADESYIQDQRPGVGMYTAGYYPHNYDFLAFAAMMIGQRETSLDAADAVTTLLPAELFGAPGMDFLQHWSVRPLLLRTRFALWDDILAAPEPDAEQPHARAISHYARGRALAATGRTAAARDELTALRDLQRSGELEGLKMEFNRSPDLAAIAERVLTGRILAAEGRFDEAIDALEEATRLEDGLLYGEPPEWSVPTRQELGEVLLEAGRFQEAESAFREDLDRFPGNGWSLGGLVTALRGQGRDDEAAQAEARLLEAWSSADVPLPTGRVGTKR